MKALSRQVCSMPGRLIEGGDPAKEGSLTVAASTRAQHGSSKDGAPNGGEKGW